MSRMPWHDLADASRAMAERFLRDGNCRWIDIAIAEGWEKSLRDLVKTAIYQRVQNGKDMPTMALLDQFSFSGDDHKYYRSHGHKLMEFDREQLLAARAARNGKVSRRMTGEATTSGE